jgi:hypothetical protein
MYPIHDHDALLLLAISLAAKRRPAEAIEIVAAIDLIQGNVPGEKALVETIDRLGQLGLLRETDGCLGLTPAAEQLVEALSVKLGYPERVFDLRQQLVDYVPTAGSAIAQDAAAWHAAIVDHRAAGKSGAKNLLMPKPAPETKAARPGQRQRKPLPKAKSRKR